MRSTFPSLPLRHISFITLSTMSYLYLARTQDLICCRGEYIWVDTEERGPHSPFPKIRKSECVPRSTPEAVPKLKPKAPERD